MKERNMEFLERVFHLKEHKTDVKTEVIAGITTFMAMAYILAVNPSILKDAGMDSGAVFTATALSAVIATLIMGLYAKLPFAQAPGMGLNAFFAYTIVIQMGYSFEFALTAVLLEGIIFILLTIFNVREAIVDSIPKGRKSSNTGKSRRASCSQRLLTGYGLHSGLSEETVTPTHGPSAEKSTSWRWATQQV